MHKDHEIEAILARLMPAALSEAGHGEIEESIDELAAESGLGKPEPSSRSFQWIWRSGAAAAAVLAALLIQNLDQNPTPLAANEASAVPAMPVNPKQELITVSQTESLESVVEAGWQDDGLGKAHQALRLQLVQRRQLLDGETGILMTVSEPREEVLLVPVNAF